MKLVIFNLMNLYKKILLKNILEMFGYLYYNLYYLKIAVIVLSLLTLLVTFLCFKDF